MGEIMGCGQLILRQDLLIVCASAQQVEDDDAFCRLIYRFTVNDDTEISIRANTDNERHDETSEREELWYSKSKPDDFLRAKYEAHDGSSGLTSPADS